MMVESLLAEIRHGQRHVLETSEYLGSYLTPTSSSIPDVFFKCSQASTAYKQLEPFFRHPLISPRKKLQVYPQIVLAILLHGDSLHYKALRQIFQIKSSYYPGVLHPSDADCSNQHLLDLSLRTFPSLVPTSLRTSDPGTKCLGHILRHPIIPTPPVLFEPSVLLFAEAPPEPIGQN